MKPRIGVVVSRFNEEITSRLLASCLKTLARAGVPASRVKTIYVPGAYEIPWAAARMARSGKFDVLIALGAILKGQTRQNDHIAAATILHLQKTAVETGTPCILGVITPDTHAQAVARTKGRLDRGREAAEAALEVLRLREELHG